MVANPDCIHYNPVFMEKGEDKLLDYLDASARAELLSLRVRQYGATPSRSHWMRLGYHALTWLKEGGEIVTWFDREDAEPLVRRSGGVYYLEANRQRRIQMCGESGVLMVSAGFCFDVMGGLDLLSFWNIPCALPPNVEAGLKEALTGLLASEDAPDLSIVRRLVERRRRCHDILQLLFSAGGPRPDAWERLAAHRVVEPAMRRLHADFREKLSIEELAKLCHLSRSQFHHNFKRSVGVAPLEYQRRLRMEEAKRLLAQDMRVTETAVAVGWDNPFLFSRLFKHDIGQSPSEFRRLCREGLDFSI